MQAVEVVPPFRAADDMRGLAPRVMRTTCVPGLIAAKPARFTLIRAAITIVKRVKAVLKTVRAQALASSNLALSANPRTSRRASTVTSRPLGAS